MDLKCFPKYPQVGPSLTLPGGLETYSGVYFFEVGTGVVIYKVHD